MFAFSSFLDFFPYLSCLPCHPRDPATPKALPWRKVGILKWCKKHWIIDWQSL